MAEEETIRLEATAAAAALATAALEREIAHLSNRIDLKIEALASELDARVTAIDRATQVFQENLTRVPTEVQKAVANLEDLQNAKLEGVRAQIDCQIEGVTKNFESRVNAIDKAAQVFHEDLTRVPTDVTKAVENLEALQNVKFQGVQVQFSERDVRVEQQARDTRVAVDAALQAAEKAVGKQTEASALSAAKSEAAFSKQADQQAALVQTTTGALRDQLEDVKSRVTRIESQAIGQLGARGEQHTSASFIVSIIAVVVSLLSILGAILLHFAAK